MRNSDNLYVWFNTLAKKPQGLPFIDNIWISENYILGKKPESMNYEWMKYDYYFDGFPPDNPELKFPEELFFIVQDTKALLFDWMAFNQNIMIVSELFLSFLKTHIYEECFEISYLKTVSRNAKKLDVGSKYYAIRIGKYFDDLFLFSEENKKRAVGLRDVFLYPNIKINENVKDGIFFLSRFGYLETLIMTDAIKNVIEKEFYEPEIYKIEDYPYVYNNRFSY